MVRRLTDEPPMRGLEPEAVRPGAIGRVEPIGLRPPPRRRRGPDWGLVLITLAFLGGAGGLLYFGYLKTKDGLLEAGETHTIAGRPDTVIPDNGGTPPATRPGATGASGTTAGTSGGTSGGTATPHAPMPSGSGYSLTDQGVQGGDVSTRPGAHSAPEPQGHEAPRPTSSAPGTLQAPPGVKPVK